MICLFLSVSLILIFFPLWETVQNKFKCNDSDEVDSTYIIVNYKENAKSDMEAQTNFTTILSNSSAY